jgi:5-methylcytosine-specific restriction endonuclease McrA
MVKSGIGFIAVKFNKVPLKRPRLTMTHLRERDGGRCAYTEQVLKPEECSMEHVTPRSKGGATEWKNAVPADKRINNIRGNRSLKEAGLTLKIQRGSRQRSRSMTAFEAASSFRSGSSL